MEEKRVGGKEIIKLSQIWNKNLERRANLILKVKALGNDFVSYHHMLKYINRRSTWMNFVKLSQRQGIYVSMILNIIIKKETNNNCMTVIGQE